MCRPQWVRAMTAAHHLGDLTRLRLVRDRIDREYAQPLDVVGLARGVGMSAGQLSLEFRLAYGESPHSHLMARRIGCAVALLRRGHLSIAAVCVTVGCTSLAGFTRHFTELVGVSPSVYRDDQKPTIADGSDCVAAHVARPSRIREASALARV